MYIFLVYNNGAGNLKAKKLFNRVTELLSIHEITYDLFIPRYHKHAIDEVQYKELSNYDAIIAAGGDGTIFEVVNGYMANSCLTKPPLGFIPLGTGNAFTREFFSDDKSWEKAIKVIANNNIKYIDVMRATNYKRSFYFVGVMGFGLLTLATSMGTPLKKIGPLSYVIAGIFALLLQKSIELELSIDNEIIKTTSLLLCCSNTQYISNLLIAPKASHQDGLIDVVNVKNMSRSKLLGLIPLAFSGKHVNRSEVEYYKAERVAIVSKPKIIPSPDGEFVEKTPISIECLKQILPVLV